MERNYCKAILGIQYKKKGMSVPDKTKSVLAEELNQICLRFDSHDFPDERSKSKPA